MMCRLNRKNQTQMVLYVFPCELKKLFPRLRRKFILITGHITGKHRDPCFALKKVIRLRLLLPMTQPAYTTTILTYTLSLDRVEGRNLLMWRLGNPRYLNSRRSIQGYMCTTAQRQM